MRSRGLDTQGMVGNFFQHLMTQILECDPTPRGYPAWGDMSSLDLQIRVESKSRGDVNSLEIRAHQIREYEEDPPFPLEYSLYSLAYYQSTERFKAGQPRPRGFSPKTSQYSLIRSIKNEGDMYQFLSSHIKGIYLVDLSIVTAFEKKFGAKPCRMVGRREETAVQIGWERVNELLGEDASFIEGLQKLKLRPTSWAKGVYPMHITCTIGDVTFPVRFTLITLLKKPLNARIAYILGRRQALSLT